MDVERVLLDFSIRLLALLDGSFILLAVIIVVFVDTVSRNGLSPVAGGCRKAVCRYARRLCRGPDGVDRVRYAFLVCR